MKSKLTSDEERAVRVKAAIAGFGEGGQQVAVNVGDAYGYAAALRHIGKVASFTRMKAPPQPADIIDEALMVLRGAATTAAARVGDKQISDAIHSLARQLVPEPVAAGHLTDTEKTTKTPKMIPLDALLQGSAAGQAADARTIGAHYAGLRGER